MSDSDQNSTDFFNQFLDDYFDESEEHLANVRRHLLTLEQFVDQPAIETAVLDELFRSFHTLKGISGMVGLSPAEELAHEMESYLRVLREKQTTLSKDGFEALIDGTRTLENVIQAYRHGGAGPDTTQAISELERFVTNRDTSSEPTSHSISADATATTSRPKWRFVFVPGPAHAQAGINVNTIRARLESIGEIVQASPLIEAGEVTFEFIVATSADETTFAGWDQFGLGFAPFVEQKPAPSKDTVEQTASVVPTISGSTVRVDLSRLDQLMLQVSDLVVSRARLDTSLRSLRPLVAASEWRKLQEVSAVLSKQLKVLRNGVMRVRMVPVAEIFDRMRFVVRDLARETDKKVVIDLSGQETEIDKFLVERLMDPLLHLVRNAVSHGIEPEADRIRAGKSPQGHISLRAQTAGDVVVIEITDDGRGIDVDRIAAKAPEAELLDADGHVDTAVLLDVISAPGFSTRTEADRESGRGVGMDVVRTTINELDGVISLDTTPGQGTQFRITLPLTLAITDALIASVGGQTFAIHQASVREVVEIERQSVKVMENNEIVLHREGVLPLVRLSKLFNLEERQDPQEGRMYAFVVGSGQQTTGLVVDKVLGLREVVVRSLNDPLVEVQGFAGATELGDGRPILILDATEILERSRSGAAV